MKSNVLIVDDQPENLVAIDAILAPLGETVFSAGSGKEALRLVLDQDFAAIVLDIRMPGMDGFDTASLIRGRARSQATPILFVSAMNADREALLAGYRLGAVEFAFKPLDPEVLRSKVAGYVELHRLKQRAAAHERDLRGLFVNNADGTLVVDAGGTIAFVNPAAERLLNRSAEQLLRTPFAFPMRGDQPAEIEIPQARGLPRSAEMRVVPTTWEDKRAWVVSLRDVTHLKQAARWERLTSDVLALLNAPDSETEALRGVLQLVKDCFGIEAVALRLRAGEDFPVGEAIGFPEHLPRTNCPLFLRDAQGVIVRDAKGNPVPVCLCGQVIGGGAAPRAPRFTEGGSFWRNSSAERWASITEGGLQDRACSSCRGEGYESIALIPVHAGTQSLGLLQLVDSRRYLLTPEMILFLEGLCARVGAALARGRAEAALHDSEKRYRELFEFNETLLRSLPFPMEIVDHEGRVLFTNERFQQLTASWQPGERRWARTADTQHPREGRPGELGLTIGQSTSLEVSDLYGGRTFEILYTGITFQDQPAVLEIFRDVTETRRLQAQLAQADRLTTMGTLAASVAHEINNPLSFVLCNIQTISEELPELTEAMRRCHRALCSHTDPDTVRDLLGAGEEFFTPERLGDVAERVGDALSGTLRIREIARGLGTFSRVERTELAPVSLHQAIEHAITLAFNEIKYRARLVKDLGSPPMVLASDGKLSQVFLNLLLNAAHAIDEGRVEQNEIRIRTWTEGDEVLAEVSDTGKGIANEHRGKIFEPFFTTKGVGAGTGLGLSICRAIITGFGGEIGFTSELGQRTRFRIRLARAPDDWRAPHEAEPEKTRAQPTIRGRILVVDDEAGVRAAIVRILQGEHEVLTASCGQEAQALLRRDRGFDLVYCDLMMPAMSGMELHAWLAAEDAALARHVVFVTGGAFTPGASEYLAKVGNLRVDKPFDRVDFVKLTRSLVLAAKGKSAR
ncbi:MAG: response regulator [Deltaproteobacteria bacterium]|nr:response regulator [Deltaproteobacteria bacterium]